MADPREGILARVTVVAAGVIGIAAAARNAVDVGNLARPAILIDDGAEEVVEEPQAQYRSEMQIIELKPGITILARTGTADAGTLLNLYRGRLIYAILTDPVLQALCAAMRYEGCSKDAPSPDSVEPRLDVSMAFRYRFRSSDFA